MTIITVRNQAEFEAHMKAAGKRLVVADFTASWCGPCKQIAPHFTALSNTHAADAVFLKVDIDEARDVAESFNVTAVPTFIFFRNGQRLQNLRGSDSTILEAKINEFIAKGGSGEQPHKHGDIGVLISKKDSECLNESDENNFAKLMAGEGYLESDCDEQLLINIGFTQPVKLHSLRLTGPKNAPKTVCIYINQLHTLDFDAAASMQPVQMLELESKDTEKDAQIELKYVKFQNVSNIQLFVKDNQDGSDVTRIDQLQLFGTGLCSTNMSDFKRVSGHKGEVH